VLTKGDDAQRKVRKTEVLSGYGFWQEELAGLIFRVSAPSFFQVNTAVAQNMVQTVLELAQSATSSNGHIWDLYCGAGSFTLPLAQAGATVSAVEIAGSSLFDLRQNLKTHQLESQVKVFAGDVARCLDELNPAQLAVLDPPRSGLTPSVIQGLAKKAPPQLVYVSCDPQTLARDSRQLLEQGYQLLRVYPFDLFPQSPHVESIAHFSRMSTG
jgi:23S rRNA (uracil1939-C5)-methyltransferase